MGSPRDLSKNPYSSHLPKQIKRNMDLALPAYIDQACSEILKADIQTVEQLGGGDISQARLLHTSKGKFFIKINTAPEAGEMFETEAKGLQLLANSNTIRTPHILAYRQSSGQSFLLLEYIETGYRKEGFWQEFGTSLAALHKNTAPQFGLDHCNFIGSLPQSNSFHDNWAEFYTNERLQPQMELAISSNKMSNSDAHLIEKLYMKLPSICPNELPSLTHGDLWSGNFMMSIDGHPVLIDPAVSYAHREMDLAMSRLFGGFNRAFYNSYEEASPLEPGFEKRLPIYQLYYLLVHVNLFGGGYVRSVQQILKEFA